ncbi:MAG: hypothetical protein ACLGP3_03005, partial [Acidobacteriota bacterium]
MRSHARRVRILLLPVCRSTCLRDSAILFDGRGRRFAGSRFLRSGNWLEFLHTVTGTLRMGEDSIDPRAQLLKLGPKDR